MSKFGRHVHRASVRLSAETGWTECVAPWRTHSEQAHGGVVEHQVCACGAIQRVECNAGVSVRSGWTDDLRGDLRSN